MNLPVQLQRAVRRAVAVLVLAVPAAAAPGVVTAAVDPPDPEFPPNAAATIQFGCDNTTGAYVFVTMTNTSGLSEAEFAVRLETDTNSSFFGQIDVNIDQVAYRQYQLAEDTTTTVTVFGSGMTPVIDSYAANCADATGSVEAICQDGAAILTATVTNTGSAQVTAELVVDGHPDSPLSQALNPGQGQDWSLALAEDAAFTATLSVSGVGVIDQASGLTDCVQAPETTQPATTAPGTTPPPTTSPIVQPTTLPPADVPTTVTIDVDQVALPETGTATATIAGAAAVLLVAGLAIVRLARNTPRPRTP